MEDPTAAIGTDPTVANAGLTEMDAQPGDMTNGFSNHVDTPSVPTASNIDAGAANMAGGNNWDAKATTPGGEDWVQVDRDPTETDTGTNATPAAMTSTQSWAEDVPTEASAPPAYESGVGDGFREVQHHRGGRGRGGDHRGGERRGRGGFRGDRERGGRGRGGFRGDRGGGEGGHRGRGRGDGYRSRGPRGGRES